VKAVNYSGNQLLGHTRLALGRITDERLGFRKSGVVGGITGKMRIQIAFERRSLLLTYKSTHKRCRVPLNDYTAIGLTRTLLLMA
jgi:hypothetical protein